MGREDYRLSKGLHFDETDYKLKQPGHYKSDCANRRCRRDHLSLMAVSSAKADGSKLIMF